MSRLVLDTSCLIAAICDWHEHHAATSEAFEISARRGDEVTTVAHALTEAYSVLTRLPSPHRLSAEDGYRLLDANWGKSQTVALSSRDYWKLLRDASQGAVTGGLFYDAVVVAAAKKARAERLWTWNLCHLSRFEDETLRVVTPDADTG